MAREVHYYVIHAKFEILTAMIFRYVTPRGWVICSESSAGMSCLDLLLSSSYVMFFEKSI